MAVCAGLILVQPALHINFMHVKPHTTSANTHTPQMPYYSDWVNHTWIGE